MGPHTFLCCTTHPEPSLTSGGRQRKGFHFIQWQTDTVPIWMSVSWYGGAVKSPDCQKCYSWEIGALFVFCLQCFRIGIPGWKTISMQSAEQGCWEFKPFSPLSKCQHFLIPTGKGKKKCLHSQGPNACSSFPCHQMPLYCITQPRDLTQEQSSECPKLWEQQGKNQKQITQKTPNNKRHCQYYLFIEAT